MKKYKQLIIGFLIGIIVATSVGVSATILYNADEIGFTPDNEDWQVDNLEDALNTLYTTKMNNIDNLSLVGYNYYWDTSDATVNYTADEDCTIIAFGMGGTTERDGTSAATITTDGNYSVIVNGAKMNRASGNYAQFFVYEVTLKENDEITFSVKSNQGHTLNGVLLLKA